MIVIVAVTVARRQAPHLTAPTLNQVRSAYYYPINFTHFNDPFITSLSLIPFCIVFIYTFLLSALFRTDLLISVYMSHKLYVNKRPLSFAFITHVIHCAQSFPDAIILAA